MKTNYSDIIIMAALTKLNLHHVFQSKHVAPVKAKKTFICQDNVRVEAGTLFYVTGMTCNNSVRDGVLRCHLDIKFPSERDLERDYYIECSIDAATCTLSMKMHDTNTTALVGDMMVVVGGEPKKYMCRLYDAYTRYQNESVAYDIKKDDITTIASTICGMTIVGAVITALLSFIAGPSIARTIFAIIAILSIISAILSYLYNRKKESEKYADSENGKRLQEEITALSKMVMEEDSQSVKAAMGGQ